MIISASYKTDIPTFYGEWFMNRLRSGYCKVINPYGKQVQRVSLRQEDVDGIVFWTKNIAPFLCYLPEIYRTGIPFVIQYTINSYPRILETSVVDAKTSVANAASVRERFGPVALVWRYDTILFSSVTPVEFHLQNFRALAAALRGVTDEVVISFAHVYQKTKRNLETACLAHGVEWWDPPLSEKQKLVSDLVRIANSNSMRLTICSQSDLLVQGAAEARCVDARRIEQLSGRPLSSKIKGNRDQCIAMQSKLVTSHLSDIVNTIHCQIFYFCLWTLRVNVSHRTQASSTYFQTRHKGLVICAYTRFGAASGIRG